MNDLPLSGRRIVVTRPKGQAELLLSLLRHAGGEALDIPALEILDLEDLSAFFDVIDRLDSFDTAVFVSRNAVRKAFSLIAGRRWPAALQLATVGNGTRDELVARGFSGVLAPNGRADSEALLAMPEFASIAGRMIAIFRGEDGRSELGDTLAARGAIVEYAPCYRRSLPAASAALLAAAWERGRVDAVTVSSGEGLANLLAMLGAGALERLAETRLFVPHPRIADAAARRGLARVTVAGPGDAETAASLVAYFGGASYN